jgi:hypothetical protein
MNKIVEEFRALPPEEQRQLLEMLEQETGSSERAKRVALARTIRGKYAHLMTSSEDFITHKRDETKLEDSKFEDRR